jgi:hypothetical protein
VSGVPPTTALPGARRWLAVLFVLAAAWLLTPHPVPLYDGIGFPDEPYRFVPARAAGPAATSAVVTLKVAAGSNTGGLIANSGEVGPQVSVFAPPHAFRAAGSAPITLAVRPVPPTAPLPSGQLESNVYQLSFSSLAGPVTLDPAAQPPAITMRAAAITATEPVFEYRPDPTSPWRELKTRLVGRDIFNTTAPGAGEYALVLTDAPARASGGGGGSSGALYGVLGATLVLMVVVIVGVRVMSRRAAT